jgi:hypothetical protein
MSNGPWPNIAALVRNHPIVEKKIRENERIIRALPFLDLEAVWEVYREHLDGTDRYKELYGLLSLLEMPVTKRIARVEE